MNNLRGVLYAVVSSATFGLIPLFSIPLLQGGMSSPAILFYRFGLAAAMMGLIALATRRPLRITWPQTGTLLLLGAMYSVTALGLLRSYTYIPSSVATTINFLYPLGVAIVMTLFFREKNSVWLLVAILISLVGVALLSWGDIGGPQSDRAIVGVGFAGATVLTYTIYIVGVKKSRISRLDPMIQAFYVLLFSACFFLVYALSTTGAPLPGKWHLWQNLLLLALVPTVVSNLTLVLAIKEIGSTMTSILGSMEPLTAVLVGVLHFGEKFGLDSASGLILIITAVIIVILQAKKKEHPQNLLLLALVPTVVSNLTLVLAIKEIGSTMTSILGSMEPLTAVLVGVLHFGEKFGLDSASGLILIITAVIIVILQAKKKEHPQTLPHESIH